MAVTHAAEPKAEGNHRAAAKHPLCDHPIARFPYDIRLSELAQSFLVGVRSHAAPPIDALEIGARAGCTASGQKGHDQQ